MTGRPLMNPWAMALVGIACGVVTAVVAVPARAPAGPDSPPGAAGAADMEDIFPIRLDLTVPKRRINPGSQPQGVDYYNVIAKQLGFPGNKAPVDLNALLDYFGYTALRAEHLDGLPPDVLMDRDKLRQALPRAQGPNELSSTSWDVLAARYFSPKTSDVSGRSKKLSWRKVVRLKPQPGSPAARVGLASLHFLSVIYVEDPKADPFGSTKNTMNIQVMLSRDPTRADPKLDSAYWLVFEPAADKYVLGYATGTSWDAADPDIVCGHRQYFVPTACLRCHGNGPGHAVLNFLDTDWYIDKAQPGDDFGETVGRSPYGPLYDCGKDEGARGYEAGFEVLRALNREILAQNRAADPDASLPQSGGAVTWCQIHATSDRHVPPLGRAIGDKTRDRVWKAEDPLDRDLLPLLSRYCYRCHGTVDYNVFNKEDVILEAPNMIHKLNEDDPKKRMPQDRDLTKDKYKPDRDRLLRLLTQLQIQNPNR